MTTILPSIFYFLVGVVSRNHLIFHFLKFWNSLLFKRVQSIRRTYHPLWEFFDTMESRSGILLLWLRTTFLMYFITYQTNIWYFQTHLYTVIMKSEGDYTTEFYFSDILLGHPVSFLVFMGLFVSMIFTCTCLIKCLSCVRNILRVDTKNFSSFWLGF